MKISRSELRKIIAESSHEMWMNGQDEYEEQQSLLQSEEFNDDYDMEREEAFEDVPQVVEKFLEKYPDLTDIRGMVEHALSTGNPEDLGEQMMKIGARLALMAKRYPEMAQAMLEELQDQ